MNLEDKSMPHSAGEEWLATYAAGTLSNPKALLLACQAELRPEIGRQINQLDEVGGALLETAPGEAVSAGFVERMMLAIDGDRGASMSSGAPAASAEIRAHDPVDPANSWMPQVLRTYLRDTGITLNWRSIGLGLKCAWLTQSDSGERLYLLKARPGLKVPVHAHHGEEWTLVLQGGYHVGETGYARGDLHSEDESCLHQPVIDDDGEECISIIADEGRIRLNNWLLSLMQPVFRL